MKRGEDAAARCGAIWNDADLGDPRLARRAALTARRLARRPSAPLPAAMGSDAAVQGTYRFVNNSRVEFETLIEVQAEVARLRAAEESGDVLVLHDTTDCAFTHLDPEEVGYLNTGKAGFRLHASLVVDALRWRRPFGVVAAETVHRRRPRRQSTRRRPSGPETAKWKNKEFDRWRRGIELSQARLAGCTRVIHVADRESDSYELMQATLAVSGRFVFRVRVDRRGRLESGAEWSTVTNIARQLEGSFEREVPLSARKSSTAPTRKRVHPPRRARLARLRFAATRVEVPRPRYLRDPVPQTLAINLVHVFEVEPPDGEPGVEWLLYTTESVETVAAVERVVDIYRTRWLSEEFHAALKGGCAFESREFESRHALLNMLALTLPIACEVLALRSGARSDDRRPASAVLTPEQLRVLRRISPYHLPRSPTALDALLAVAALGGHLKRNGPPGWKVMSRGMTELLTCEAAEFRRGRHEDM